MQAISNGARIDFTRPKTTGWEPDLDRLGEKTRFPREIMEIMKIKGKSGKSEKFGRNYNYAGRKYSGTS